MQYKIKSRPWQIVTRYSLFMFFLLLTLYGQPQSNRPLHVNAVIGTLAVDGWAVTFQHLVQAAASPSPLLAVPNVTVHPSTASVPTLFYVEL